MAMNVISAGKSAFLGTSTQLRVKETPKVARASIVVRAQQEEKAIARRSALGLVAGAAALFTKVSASEAAFGDAANVFGKATNTSGFIPYAGEGYAILLPSKWNPSREREFPGIVLRYEDNGDAVNNITVISRPTSKNSIEEYGSTDQFLKDISFLLGEQTFSGQTQSEGGFKPDRVSSASVLGSEVGKDKKGKSYYKYQILTRTADGDEGGRHQLINATVSGSKLWICKVQVGDKRWFKGAQKFAEGAADSFVVA